MPCFCIFVCLSGVSEGNYILSLRTITPSASLANAASLAQTRATARRSRPAAAQRTRPQPGRARSSASKLTPDSKPAFQNAHESGYSPKVIGHRDAFPTRK
eukprot:6179982-Pleurochrysis_carterae.AAC.9